MKPRRESYEWLRYAIVPTALIAMLLLAPAPALAVEPAPEPQESGEQAESDDSTAPRGLEERIKVTARKREEDVQEVPVAVTVVTGEALEDAGATDISEIQASVPNLSIYAGRNQSTTLTAFMRGVGQADPLWGVDPGVGLYLDDVYIARPQGALLDVFDIERIEVLRGPQGTLYGKNTIGGAIKYVSREMTDEARGRIAFSPGSYSNQDIKFSMNGPLVEGKLRGKVAVARLKHDGYGRNLFQNRDVSDKDSLSYRVGLDFLASDDVTLKFRYDKTEDRSEPKGLTRLQANPFCPTLLGMPCPPLANIFDTESGLEPTNSTDDEGYSLTLQWDINDAWTFKSITAYRESQSINNIDFDTTPARITDVFADYADDQTTQEFQFLYQGQGDFAGVFGAYYLDGQAGGFVRNIFFNSSFGTTQGDTFTESYALFFDGSYRITDPLTFNFGLRYTDEDKRGVAFNALYTDDTFTVPALVLADYDETTNFSSVSPKLGLDYQFNQNVMGYVTLSRGFKSGGYNVRAQSAIFPLSGLPFDDETLTVAEFGLKSLLGGGSTVLNAAAFYGDYTDIQVSTFTSYDSDGDGMDDAFFGNFLNAGDATLTGLELELDWKSKSVDWFGVSGNLSWLDADPDGFLDENGDTFVDTQVITNAPEVTGAVNLNFYKPALGGLITASVGYAYRDDSVLTNEGGEDPLNPGQPLLPLMQESFSTVNARVAWLSKDGTWGVSVVGKNLTDEEYLTNGYNIPVLGVFQGSYGQPLTVVGNLEYNFF